VNERVPYGVIRIHCTCCQLTRDLRDRDGPEPTICDTCYQHRGQLPDKRLARAESHEAMLRECLTACRASEARARKSLATARDRVTAALASRGALADRLVTAAEEDRKHNCLAHQLGRDPHIVEFARKHRERNDNYWDRDETLLGHER
jgi:hypothetical protein